MTSQTTLEIRLISLNMILEQIDNLIVTLDNSKSECECCHRVMYNNFNDHKLLDRLTQTRNQMERLAQVTRGEMQL